MSAADTDLKTGADALGQAADHVGTAAKAAGEDLVHDTKRAAAKAADEASTEAAHASSKLKQSAN